MTEAELTLRPMTRAEWDDWIPRQLAGYALLIANSGEMSQADAWAKATADTARSFHAGYATPGQLVFRLRRPASRSAGSGWPCRGPIATG